MKKIKKLLAVALACCLAVGITYTAYTQGWLTGSNRPGGGQTNTVDVVDGDGNGMGGGKVYELPANMAFLAPTMESMSNPTGVTVTATVLPEIATNKAVDWAIEWVSTSGGNASDYVIVTPSFDGSNIATIECLQAFGKQLKVVVTSRQNPDVKAECVLDYLAKLEFVEIFIAEVGQEMYSVDTLWTTTGGGDFQLPTPTFEVDFSDFYTFLESNTLNFHAEDTVGTKSDFLSLTLEVKYSERLKNFLENIQEDGFLVDNYVIFGEDFDSNTGWFSLGELFNYSGFEFWAELEYNWLDWLALLDENDEPDFTFTYIVEYKYFENEEITFTMSFDGLKGLKYVVNEIVLDVGGNLIVNG